MLLYKLLVLVVAGRCCLALNADVTEVVVAQGSTATLICPHATGAVTWTHFINGKQVPLVSERYSFTNNALVISKVELSDDMMYMCNKKNKIYLKVLNVTTEPNTVDPGDDGLVLVPESDHRETQQPFDLWKIPVGMAIGSALVLLAVISLRLYTAKRQPDVEEAAAEVVYEEIRENLGQDLLRHDDECVYSLAQNPLQTGTSH